MINEANEVPSDVATDHSVFSATKSTKQKPVLSFFFHRHGMRTPFVYFDGIGNPLDQKNTGMLTNRGRQQMAALGSFLAMKHGASTRTNTSIDSAKAAFLAAQLVTPQVLSSSTPRCVESAKILFKAFVNKDLEVKNYKTDYAALYFDMIERNIEAMMAIPFETPVGKTIGDYVNYLNDKASSPYEAMDKKYQIAEALLLAYHNGFELPAWAEPDTLQRCCNKMFRGLIAGFERDLALETLEDVKFRLDALPTVLVNWMSYSMSDIHIVATLDFLGMPISHWPDFAAAFELSILTDGSVTLDQIDTSPEAEVREKSAIYRSTVSQLKDNIDRVLQSSR